jgi:hypothetical protein
MAEQSKILYNLSRYQDPTEADKLAKIQKDLDETKVLI